MEPNSTNQRDDLVLVGEITAPFGVRGEVKMRALMEKPESLTRLPCVTIRFPDSKRFDERRQILKTRRHQSHTLLSFADVTDMDAADLLRDALIFIHSDELPKLEEGAYYARDLIGLQVHTEAGQDLGIIENVLFYPANDVYETPIAMIPAVEAFIVKVDLAAKLMLVRDVEGLLKAE